MAKAYLEVDEVIRLEKATTNLRDCILVRALFYLGCRVSEVLGAWVPTLRSKVANRFVDATFELKLPDFSESCPSLLEGCRYDLQPSQS